MIEALQASIPDAAPLVVGRPAQIIPAQIVTEASEVFHRLFVRRVDGDVPRSVSP